MAQLQVVTGRQGVYMMYPGPAVNEVIVGGQSVGAPLGMGGGPALGGVDPLLGPALDPGLVTGSGRWEWLPPNLVTPLVVTG